MTSPLQQTFRFSAAAAPPLRQNLVVEAGAGTGKTSAIVAEVLKLLLANEDLAPERIVLMTFTEKAAGEIADRIHAALAELELQFDGERVAWPVGSTTPLFVVPEGSRDAYRRACQRQLSRIESIRSQTIHSFCQSLLRSYPVEAGLDPQFKIVEGFERSLLYGQLYDAWFDEETRVKPTPQALQEWEFLLAHVGYLFQIRDLIFSLLARRDLLMEAAYDFGDLSEVEPNLVADLAVIRRSDISRVNEVSAATVFRYIQEVTPPGRGSLDDWISYFSPIAVPLREANLPQDPALKKALITLRTGSAKGSSIHERLLRHRSTVAIHALTRRFIEFLDREKRKLGVVDFDDLLLRTLELLQQRSVLDRVRGQFDHIFVDEFQDTDRTQARIIEKLGTDGHGAWVPGRITVVGDPKQSIYGFRRADPETYRSMTNRLVEAGAIEQFITDHYRSDAPLLDAINAMFTAVFANASSDANVFRPPYRALRAGREWIAGDPARNDTRLTFLHATHDDKSDRHLSEAEAVAEWIEAKRDRAGRDLRRFAILFRRTTRLDDYLDTLDRHGIEYVLPPTKAFLDRRAPVDAVAVLRAIGRPFDRGAEISAARTPYFALTDEEIALGTLSGGEAGGAWRDFTTALNGYREAAAHLTVAGTLDVLIESTGIEGTYDSLLDGPRARRHLEHLRTIAFQYDQKIGGSIRQFVDEIERRREEPDETEPSLADDDSNAVRIMTVHAAKGLEFETVILPDLVFPTRGGGDKQQLFVVEEPRSLVMTGRAQSFSAHYRLTPGGARLKSVAGEREEAEMRRLLYVAVTRAITDVVFVCNTASFKKDGFFGCLASTFAFEKDTFESLWPSDPGRTLATLQAGGASVPVAFEKMAIRDVARRTAGRLRDADLERQLGSGPIVDASVAPPPPTPSFSSAESAIARASSKNRLAGTLLHRFLERWDNRSDAETLLQKLAGEVAATPPMVETVRRRVAALRSSSTFARIERATTIGREIPIRFTAEDGRVVEKRIDRLLREDGAEVVIDYKSGAPTDQRLAADRDQVARYCRAIEAMTGRPCQGWLWYVGVDCDELVTA